MSMDSDTKNELYRFFAIAFDAAPGVTYMSQLADAVAANMTVPEIVEIWTTKPQFLAVYPNFLDNEAFAALLIENVIGTAATQAVKDETIEDATAALNAGWSRGEVMYQCFTNLASGNDDPDWVAKYGDVAKLLENKVAYAKYFTEVLLMGSEASPDLDELRAVLANVTANSATDPASIAASVAEPFVLTEQRDSLIGGATHDTFVAPSLLDVNPDDQDDGTEVRRTLGDRDVMDGGEGTDTLNLFAAAGGNEELRGTVKNIERINIFGSNNLDAGVVDAAFFEGSTTITVDGDATAVDNVDAQVVIMDGEDVANAVNYSDDVTSGTVEMITGALAAEGADLVTLNIKVGGDAVLASATVETLNLNATDDAVVDVAGLVALTAIDGSASAGGLTIDAGATVASINTGSGDDTVTTTSEEDVSVSTGAGDDVIGLEVAAGIGTDVDAGTGDDAVVMGRALEDGDVLDGGAGIDTLSVAAEGELLAGNYVRLNSQTGFEILSFQGAVGADASELEAFDSLVFESGGSEVVNAVESQALVVAGDGAFEATAAADETLTIEVEADVDLTLNAESAEIAVKAGAGAFLAGGDGLVNASVDLQSSGVGAGFAADVADLGDLTELTIDGAGFAEVDNTGGSLTTVDASGLSSWVDADDEDVDSVFLYGSGAGKESITVGGALDWILVNSLAGGSQLTTMDTIEGLEFTVDDEGVATGDRLAIEGDFVAHEFGTAPSSLQAALNTVSALVDDNSVVFVYGGNTYIFQEGEGTADGDFEATDTVVKLVGEYDLDLLIASIGGVA